MSRRTKRSRGALAAVVCLSLVAAACGGDDDEATTPRAAVRRRPTAGGGHDDPGRPPPPTRPRRPTTTATDETRHGRDHGTDETRRRRDDGDRRRRTRPRPRRPPTATSRAARCSRCRPTTARPRPPRRCADGEPIKIGFIGPQTGPLAAFGVIGQGMQMYFDKINEEGGVDGHPLELVTKDDAYDPARSAPGRAGGHRGRRHLRLGVPGRHAERRRHPPAARRRLRPAGAGRHRLPELGRPGQLAVDDRRHPVVHRRGGGLDRLHRGEVPGGRRRSPS